jgi:hypothetical protein
MNTDEDLNTLRWRVARRGVDAVNAELDDATPERTLRWLTMRVFTSGVSAFRAIHPSWFADPTACAAVYRGHALRQIVRAGVLSHDELHSLARDAAVDHEFGALEFLAARLCLSRAELIRLMRTDLRG